MISEIVTSSGGSSSRARISDTIQPIARPTRMPPTPVQMNSGPAFQAEKLPPTAAATATR